MSKFSPQPHHGGPGGIYLPDWVTGCLPAAVRAKAGEMQRLMGAAQAALEAKAQTAAQAPAAEESDRRALQAAAAAGKPDPGDKALAAVQAGHDAAHRQLVALSSAATELGRDILAALPDSRDELGQAASKAALDAVSAYRAALNGLSAVAAALDEARARLRYCASLDDGIGVPAGGVASGPTVDPQMLLRHLAQVEQDAATIAAGVSPESRRVGAYR